LLLNLSRCQAEVELKEKLFSVFIPMSPKSSIIFVNFTTWNLQKKKKLKSSLKQSQVSKKLKSSLKQSQVS